jgi:hypothetical protein
MSVVDIAPRPRSFRLYDVTARNIQPHSIDNRTGHLLLKGAPFQNAIYASPVGQRHCVATKANYVSPSRSIRFHWVSTAGRASKRLPVPYGKKKPKQPSKGRGTSMQSTKVHAYCPTSLNDGNWPCFDQWNDCQLRFELLG